MAEARPATGVDFPYSFASPHRLTVALPDRSGKTLLDLQPGSPKMSWSYQDLTGYPRAAFETPPVDWSVLLTPGIDGRALARSNRAAIAVDNHPPPGRKTQFPLLARPIRVAVATVAWMDQARSRGCTRPGCS